MKPRFYLDLESGVLETATAVRNRFHPRISNQLVFLPKDESRWGDATYKLLGIVPVYDAVKPAVSDEFYAVRPGSAEKRDDGRLYVIWEVSPRFEGSSWRSYLYERLDRIHDEQLAKPLVVEGVPIKATPKGLALLQLAARNPTGQGKRAFVAGSDVYEVSDALIAQMEVAAARYIQACYNHRAVLTRMIAAAERPDDLDLTAGWPTP